MLLKIGPVKGANVGSEVGVSKLSIANQDIIEFDGVLFVALSRGVAGVGLGARLEEELGKGCALLGEALVLGGAGHGGQACE